MGISSCIYDNSVSVLIRFLDTFYQISLIIYDSMLGDVTDDERVDNVSSQGYAWGYIGSCIPFIACLVLVLGADKIGIGIEAAMGISFAVVATFLLRPR